MTRSSFEARGGHPRPESTVERRTGRLFGELWSRYDRALFEESVGLFRQRWLANGEAPDALVGKRCLDVGCGGGRYTIAMARMGAELVVGMDVGAAGVADARGRAAELGEARVAFQQGSALQLPFPDHAFDFVCCSGVLHHTPGVERGLAEVHRVLRPGGRAYLLLYGDGGLYWPLTLTMRPFAAILGLDEVARCIEAAELAPNKRRTILDDLFVPILETYSVQRVGSMLHDAGFAGWRRWTDGQLDHESDPCALLRELELRERVWSAGAATAPDATAREIEMGLAATCRAVADTARRLVDAHTARTISSAVLRSALTGTGHHRIVAETRG